MATRLTELFVKDVWLKLLALALALVTWLYIDMELREPNLLPWRLPAPLSSGRPLGAPPERPTTTAVE